MTFKELPEEVKTAARNTLTQILRELDPKADLHIFEKAGEKVAAAFIKMEHHDSAPESEGSPGKDH
ncbi:MULTISPECIES: hypothetical protein [Enterobacter]|uniref:hypothetical protein n=1 Tax=Enterobacter TaxID=547 RepID=UPI002235E4A3|nr:MULTISPECIES: hypothetical protein [Enterobacter]MCW4986271.1 hypothetical protein [Enterobacter mori]MDO2449751.1 hypothetical protein [Enterobacter vonholyi]